MLLPRYEQGICLNGKQGLAQSRPVFGEFAETPRNWVWALLECNFSAHAERLCGGAASATPKATLNPTRSTDFRNKPLLPPEISAHAPAQKISPRNIFSPANPSMGRPQSAACLCSLRHFRPGSHHRRPPLWAHERKARAQNPISRQNTEGQRAHRRTDQHRQIQQICHYSVTAHFPFGLEHNAARLLSRP